MSLLVTLALIWASGTLLLQLLGSIRGRGLSGWLRQAAESFGLGAAACYLFFLVAVWFRPAGLFPLAAVPLLAGGAFLWKGSRGKAADHGRPRPEPWKRGEILAGLAVAFTFACGLGLLLATPLLDWDTRILWGLKAKILATERTLISDTFRDPYRLHIHPRYPLLVPWLASLPAQVAGGFRERHFQTVAGLAALLGVAQLYRLGRECGSRMGALAGALLMVVTAAWLRSLFAAGVELTLLLFLLLGVQALWRWLDGSRTTDIALAAVYLFGCASVKNEGVVLALCLVASLGIVLLLRGRNGPEDLRGLVVLLAIWGGLMAVWWRHVHFIPPVSDENYPARLRPEYLNEGLQRLPLLVREMGSRAFDVSTWHVTWAVFPLLCGWGWRRGQRSDPKALLLVLTCLLYGIAIGWIYLLSPWRDLAQHIHVTFDRVFLPLLPLVILLLQRTVSEPPPA